MKMGLIIIAATLATTVAAQADDRLNARIELMKVAYACDGTGAIKYRTARDAALRAEQMATVGSPDAIVLGVDKGLRDGSIPVQVERAKCADTVEQMMLEMRSRGY